jgi:hypothetical protein
VLRAHLSDVDPSYHMCYTGTPWVVLENDQCRSETRVDERRALPSTDRAYVVAWMSLLGCLMKPVDI